MNANIPHQQKYLAKLKRGRELRAEKIKLLKEQKICLTCRQPKEQPDNGRLRCQECRVKLNAYMANRRAKRTAAGLCSECSSRLETGNKGTKCQTCRDRALRITIRHIEKQRNGTYDRVQIPITAEHIAEAARRGPQANPIAIALNNALSESQPTAEATVNRDKIEIQSDNDNPLAGTYMTTAGVKQFLANSKSGRNIQPFNLILKKKKGETQGKTHKIQEKPLQEIISDR